MSILSETKQKKGLGKVIALTENGKNIYEMTQDIQVNVIDWKPLIQSIQKQDADLADGEYEIRGLNGAVYLPHSKSWILIDNECCGITLNTKNVISQGRISTIKLFEDIGIYELHPTKEGSRIISMMPNFYVDIDMEDVMKLFTSEILPLWKYMGSRYEYNPRIKTNTLEIVELFNGR